MKKILVVSLLLVVYGTALPTTPRKQFIQQVTQKIKALNREIDAKTQVRDKLAVYLRQTQQKIKGNSNN